MQPGYKEHAPSTAHDLKDNAAASAFRTVNHHKAFDNKLAEVFRYVNADDYATALAKVQKDLMPKAEGVKLGWVTETSQGAVYGQVQSMVSYLQRLQQ